MKCLPSLMVAVVLVAADARGQADMIIKQRAREISNQNNVRQGVPPSGQPSARPAAASTAAAPTPVQQSLARVRADLAAIKENTPITAAQKEQLAKDLMATAHGAKKPTQATVATLAADLATAFVQKPMSETDRNRLLTDLAAALNPANIQPAQIQAVVADVQAIFQVNGLPRKDAVKIAEGVKAIAAEARS